MARDGQVELIGVQSLVTPYNFGKPEVTALAADGGEPGGESGGSASGEVAKVQHDLETIAADLDARAVKAAQGQARAWDLYLAFAALAVAFRKLSIALGKMAKNFKGLAKAMRQAAKLMEKVKASVREAEGDEAALKQSMESLAQEAGEITPSGGG